MSHTPHTMYEDLMDEDICNNDICNTETEPEHKQMTLKDYWQPTTSTGGQDKGKEPREEHNTMENQQEMTEGRRMKKKGRCKRHQTGIFTSTGGSQPKG